MSRIAATFDRLRAARRAALVPFVTAGDPSPDLIPEMLRSLAANGADVIELGVPFSDPMADGPAIQRASERALRAGTGLARVLDAVRDWRREDDRTPVVLMGYANPVEHMGAAAFAARARDAGVDGVLVVDYPPEESADWVRTLGESGIDPIFLLSPTSSEARIDLVSRMARGYIYYVSLKGVTGAAHIDTADVERMLGRIRSRTQVPVGVGFGIREPETARAIARFADAVVIGSRLVEEIERSTPAEAAARAGAVLAAFRAGVDAAARDRAAA
ncbi:MAG: tryptophan synthase subunit alpha [Burkholderiales bacterium]|nr:tryptophan synthase subunit alpha [Burkholderiales bacterium]MBZ0251497.1 tryptophan synthase subunit alpha [Burkholderiales bacterium]